MTVVVWVADPGDLKVSETLMRAEIGLVDHAASHFRDDSELARCCAAAGTPVPASRYFIDLMRCAVAAAHASGGLVDPTIGASPGWKAIELGDWSVKIPLGAKLDLGAIGKAFAVDHAAARIAHAVEGRGVLVSLGGDIATAGTAPDGGWRIHVTDDHRSGPDAPGQTVRIFAGALATSGTTVRCSPAGHHIIDPRTCRSAQGPWRTVSVTARSCVDANTASTTAIVLGRDACRWLQTQGLAARLVAHDGAVMTVGGWPGGEAQT